MTDDARRPITIAVHNGERGKAISGDLWGVFLEDINYAVDGGINAELAQNGAFEYDRADNPQWSHLTGWVIGHTGKGSRDVSIRADGPVAGENPHHLAVTAAAGGVTTIANTGFDGMRLGKGERYRFTAWVRADGGDVALGIDLVDDDAREATTSTAGHVGVIIDSREWTRIAFTLESPIDTTTGALRLTVASTEGIALDTGHSGTRADTGAGTPAPAAPTLRLDWVSLRPCDEDGDPRLFREDLLEALKELRPHFMRFPGGCITHGIGTDNMYRWKRTIGAVEHRPHQFNLWGYHQSFAIGFHEYFLLCEAIGAEPVPILPVGVSCQNTPGGVTTVPMDEMDGIVADALDLLEYANGPVDSPWGAKRAAAGHPEAFHVKHLGLGNEDKINEAFRERFTLVADAVKRRYPDVDVIGTVGPTPAGEDFDAGWAFAREYGVDMVDEHAYKSPQWWFSHLDHYDGRGDAGDGTDGTDTGAKRSPRIYLGEYGSWSNMQLSALAEAAIMTSIECNGDVVRMASYAPLFGKVGHTQWHPDLIYFDNERAMTTLNYWVQRMFSRTSLTHVLDVDVAGAPRHTPAPRDRTGLRFTTKPDNAFDVTDITVTPTRHADITGTGDITGRGDGTAISPATAVTAAPVAVGDSGLTVDTGLDVVADDYRIDMTVRRRAGGDGLDIDFGAIDGSDYFRWAFGDWDDQYRILKRVGDGIADEAVQAAEGGVEQGRDYHVSIEVEHQGAHVTVAVNGTRIHEYRDDSTQKRFVACAGRNDATGETVVRIVNATGETREVDVTFDAAIAGSTERSTDCSTEAVVTSLHAAWNAGAPFAEAPAQPVERRVATAELERLTVAPYSFTVVTVPAAH